MLRIDRRVLAEIHRRIDRKAHAPAPLLAVDVRRVRNHHAQHQHARRLGGFGTGLGFGLVDRRRRRRCCGRHSFCWCKRALRFLPGKNQHGLLALAEREANVAHEPGQGMRHAFGAHDARRVAWIGRGDLRPFAERFLRVFLLRLPRQFDECLGIGAGRVFDAAADFAADCGEGVFPQAGVDVLRAAVAIAQARRSAGARHFERNLGENDGAADCRGCCHQADYRDVF